MKPVIIKALDTLKKREILNKEPFKAKAYSKVIDELKATAKEIHSFDDLKGVKGIGAKIHAKIVEILSTGKLEAAEKAKVDYSLNSYEILSGVYGIGAVKAKELIDKGIKTIENLREEVAKDPTILNDKQKIGLRYYEDILQRIPRPEMEAHERLLLENLEEGMNGVVVGSYRRGEPSSGDIDVLITYDGKKSIAKAFSEYIEKLRASGYMIEVLSEGKQKCLSIVKLPGSIARRLDLLVISPQEYPFALLYFTGSGDFNVAFRKFALSKGYTLNEHGLKLTGKVPEAIPVPNMRFEAEVFAFLGIKYKEPSQRKGAYSVEEISENIKKKVSNIRLSRKLKKVPA